MKYILIIAFILFAHNVFAKDISGLYLTHEGTEGGQSIVEIFKYNGKYYVYGLKNLENNPINDSCNKNSQLRTRKSVGVVFGYNYTENDKGEFVDGLIYNFYNCKTYYGKIVPKKDGKIDFIGSLDSRYWLSRSFTWRLLTPEEAKEYQSYRLPISELVQTINDTILSKK